MKDVLLAEAEGFVRKLFEEKLSPKNFYHNIEHTQRVVDAIEELVKFENCSEQDVFLLTLAAWFHDCGYIDQDENNEEIGAKIARDFLGNRAMPEQEIAEVEQLILATKVGVPPKTHLEKIIKDADCSHVALPSFSETSEQLRLEIKYKKEQDISELDWLKQNVTFLCNQKFYTDFAKSKWEPLKEINVFDLKQKLAKLEEKQANKIKNKKSGRGVDTMFRVVLKNHIELSAIADTKANILLSVNAIIISVALSNLVPKLDNASNSFLVYPTLILMLFSVASVILSVLSTRPNVSNDKNLEASAIRDMIKNKTTNILFFGNFYKMSLQDFEWGIDYLIENEDTLYNSLTKDLYFLGLVLERKYRLLRITYTVFMIGIIVSALSFLVSYNFLANIK
ncbi:Pycsar system effector family protein [Formosa sp. S-31]|uniref:Pycsar system effector family protein n=1 Tax=Formosa sp. S-31 TaxID=2790949 RepID=UPI003EB8C930